MGEETRETHGANQNKGMGLYDVEAALTCTENNSLRKLFLAFVESNAVAQGHHDELGVKLS